MKNSNHNHNHNHNHDTPSRPCGGQEIHQHIWDTGYKQNERGKLLLSIVITAVVMVVEIIGGYLSNSIALISDAGHMFTHLFALSISYVAIRLVSIKPSFLRTFGLYRAEVIASLVNSVFLFGITVLIVYESIERIISPLEIATTEMFIVAFIGLIVNLVTIMILGDSHHHDRNIRAAFMHMLADTLSSVAVVAGAIVIHFTGWAIIDPLAGILISLLILHWAWKLFKDAIRVLLEIAPSHIPPNEIRVLLKENDPRIKAITDMHIVEITSGMYNFSAHVEIESGALDDANDVIDKINEFMNCKYKVDHTTIQVTRWKKEN